MQKAFTVLNMLLIAAAAHGQELSDTSMVFGLGSFNIPIVYEADTEPKTLYLLLPGANRLSINDEDSLYVSAAFRDSLLQKKIIVRFKTTTAQTWIRHTNRPRPPKRKPE